MADHTLAYQRITPGLITSTRRVVARHLRLWALLLLVFAAIVGWHLMDRLVIERVWRKVAVDPAELYVEYRIACVYHWDRLVWVVGAMVGPLVLAAAYWILGRDMLHKTDRTRTVAALILAILHTMAATACVLTFLVVGMASFQLRPFRLTALLTLLGSMLAVAMVPGMLYLSVRLMDLLAERRVVPKN